MLRPQAFALAFAAFVAAGTLDTAVAQDRRSGGDGYQGIMTEEGQPARKRGVKTKKKETPEVEKRAADKPPSKKRPRGSSTYIPPPVPSPYGSPPVATVPPPRVYTPPRIDTFSDRVTRCNHSFPLNAGIGNNPVDRDSFVRQCAN